MITKGRRKSDNINDRRNEPKEPMGGRGSGFGVSWSRAGRANAGTTGENAADYTTYGVRGNPIPTKPLVPSILVDSLKKRKK